VGVYGYAKMPSLSSLEATLEDVGLGITSLTDVTAHYSQTISDWQARIATNQTIMDELAPGFAADLQLYFETVNATWGYTAKHYALTAVPSRKGELRLPV
jgi:cyclopropane-fatty-acyl-phospholipid synthase